MKTIKALWFSRHQPTVEQLEAIAAMGLSLSQEDIKEGMEWGAKDLSTREKAREVRSWVGGKIEDTGCPAYIFGVFPVALSGLAFDTMCAHADGVNLVGEVRATLFEAVNDCRSVEGGKPTFKFLRWEQTGILG